MFILSDLFALNYRSSFTLFIWEDISVIIDFAFEYSADISLEAWYAMSRKFTKSDNVWIVSGNRQYVCIFWKSVAFNSSSGGFNFNLCNNVAI